jgi:hypothetical protein
LNQQWCIPKIDAEYVYHMEDLLELYAQAYDPKRPVVCFDERPYPLIGETRQPIAVKPGQVKRVDYQYERNGVVNLFVAIEPLAGWRQVTITQQRTKVDFAHQMQALVNESYAEAELIRLVVDNLNIHNPAALYEVFAPSEARRILSKLEFHYTPKHASWLNQVEIEISVLSRQCLERRIPDSETLAREVTAWQEQRNAQRAKIDWQFSATDARVKLHCSYPLVTH